MNRTTVIALVAFAALLGAYLATRETTVQAGTRALDLTAVDPAKVTAVEVGQVRMKKEGGGWTVNGKPADAQLVQQALEAVAKVETKEVVTDRPEKHAEYEVDEAKALRLKLEREGGAPVELFVGKTARSGGAYVRRPSEDAVFVAPPAVSSHLRREANGWRSKRLVSFKSEDVTQVTQTPAGEAGYALVRDGQSWRLADGTPTPAGFRFDAMAASQLVSQLSSLQAQDFADGLGADVALPHRVEVKLSGGSAALEVGPRPDPSEQSAAQELRAHFDAIDSAVAKDDRLTRAELETIAADGARPESLRKVASRLASDAGAFARLDAGVYAATPKDDAITRADLDGAARTAGLVPARVVGDAQVYLLSGWTAAAVTKSLGELRDLSLFAFDPQKVSKLELRSGPTRVVALKDGAGWKLAEPKKLPEGFELDPALVSSQLVSVRSIRALRLADGAGLPDARTGLSRPEAVLEVTLEGGGKQALRIGKATEGGHYARGAVDGALYVVGAGEKARVERGVELFRKRPPPPTFAGPGGGLDQLPPDLRAKLEAAMRAQGATP